MFRAIVGVLLVALVAFGAATWIALEGQEVVVLHTQRPGGDPHATRVWIADDDGTSWVEAATAERPFYQDLLVAPALEVERGGVRLRMRGQPIPGPEGHARIRAMLRAKYGLADRFVGMLVDTSGSVAVKLVPAGAPS